MSSDKYYVLSNLIIYYNWKNIKQSYKNKEFKLSAPTCKDKFELPGGIIFKIILSTSLKNMKQ